MFGEESISYDIGTMNRKVVLIAHDIRSTHNIGSLLRTAECLGVERVYISGYSPYPSVPNDERLPHIHQKLTAQIHKTALGAESLVSWERQPDLPVLIQKLRSNGYTVAALEQTPDSTDISSWIPPDKIAILLGREVEGVEDALLKLCDYTVEIPLFGQKESLNVVQAAAIALYQAQFASVR